MLLSTIYTKAQAPGGVNAGISRGWKADMYEGNFADHTSFGTGTAKTTPNVWGYTGTVVGREMVTQVADYYGMEYNATLEVPQTGNYTFQLTGVDDKAWLWVNNTLIGSKMCCGNSVNMNITLPAGDVPIRIKFIEGAGGEGMGITWSGPGITANSIVDGRFVKTNATLSHWYKADQAVTAPSGAHTYITRWNNQASSSLNQNNLRLSAGAAWTKLSGVDRLVNYNVAGQFDGDDQYLSQNAAQNRSTNGLVYQNGSLQAYFPASYTNNATSFMWGQGYACSTNNVVGMYRTNTAMAMAIYGSTVDATGSAYNANESKIAEGYFNLNTGNSASRNVVRAMRVDGSTTFNTDQTNNNAWNYVNTNGIHFGSICSSLNSAFVPEFIYYPFKLSTNEEAKVNTYLAIKYGTTLSGTNYTATNGTVVWNRTTNAVYNNRIFGIGRELATEGLNQKQSQSRMQPSGNLSNNFLKIAKGALVATNNANTGVLTDGDYLIVGDDNVAMTSQVTEIPASVIVGGCTFARLAREWKSAITGAPGAVTLVAGSNDAGSFKFTGSMAGIQVMVDQDGDGNFNTGTIRTYNYSTLVGGVATFNNVILNNNEVFSFVWKQTAPGGVSSGLTHWIKANDGTPWGNLTALNDQSPTGANLTAVGDPQLILSGINFNPILDFDGDDFFLSATTFPNSLTAGEVFAFGKTFTTAENRGHMYGYGGNATGGSHYTWSNVSIYEHFGTSDRFGYTTTTGAVVDGKTGASAPAFTYSALDWNLHNVYSATNNWGITVNGRSLSTSATNTVGFDRPAGNNTNIYIGASHGYVFRGQIPEVVFYNRVLTATERKQVNSYLALKYGQTLHSSVTNYVASDGTTIMYNHATHWNNVFGIGRDDCSALEQKQSVSTNTGDNVTIGLSSIVATNEANTGSFSSDKQFLMIGNDGAGLSKTNAGIPSAYAAVSCNAARYSREWKVKNTGSVGPIQVIIGNNLNRVSKAMTNPALVVDTDGDGNFATGSITVIYVTSVRNNQAIFNNVTLPDGAVFTLCWTGAAPGGVRQPITGTLIGGENYVNGLAYKLYNGFDGDLGDGITGALLSTGYADNTRHFDDIWLRKIADNFSVELTGKILLQTGVNYKFRANSVDDRLFINVNGVTLVNATTTGTFTSATFTVPSTGYYDIIVRGSENAGAELFYVDYSINNGSTYIDIPDNILFVKPEGPSAWFSSNSNFLDSNADGANLAGLTFSDESINRNDLTFLAGTNPSYYSTNSSFIRNYNPIIWSTDDRIHSGNWSWLNGFAYGKQGKTLFTTVGTTTTTGMQMLASFGTGATNESFGTYFFDASLNTFGFANDLTSAAYLPSTQYLNTQVNVYKNYNITNTNNAQIFSNGKILTQANKDWWIRPTGNPGQLFINEVDTDRVGLNGTLSEVIFYPWDLTANEQQRVNSYLSITWGITLDQSTPQDYLTSSGTSLWNATTGATFKFDITGIGRDDCGALDQRQSTSTDGNDFVAMGRGTLAANTLLNTNAFANNLSFLAFAHNNSNLQLNTTNMPTALPTDACFMKLNRVWQTQETNTPGIVQVAAGKAGLKVYSRTRRPYLLISSSPTDFTGATIIAASRVENGIAYFDNVTFTGVKYFTFAEVNAAPGGVTNGLVLWNKADEEPVSAISTWTDFSPNNNTLSLNTGTFNNQNNIVNFNPGINMSGADFKLFQSTNTLGMHGDNTYREFYVLKGIHTSGQQWEDIITLGYSNSPNDHRWENVGVGTGNYGVFGQGTAANAIGNTLFSNSQILSSGSNGTSITGFANGFLTATNNTSTPLQATGNFRIGTDVNSANGNWNGFYGMENIIYNNTISGTDFQRIHTYLSIKYGLTQHSSSGNYLASDGTTVVYNHATHWNRITGIASDYCSGLDQRQSKNQETGALVTISTDTTNGVLATNEANTVPVANTSARTYAVFGDNNKSVLWSGRDIPVSENVRLNRVWRIKETGTISSVFIQVPDNTSVLTPKLPLVNAGKPVYLLVARSSTGGTFSSTTNVEEVEMTLNGTNWEVAYNFQDGDYFTFSTDKLCIGPAGISEGLTAWYRTDNKSLGAIAPTTGTLADELSNHNLTRNGSGTATITTGSATQFNFNNYLVLAGNANLTKSAINESTLSKANEGSVFSVHNAATFPFSLSKSGYNAITVTNNGGSWANIAGVSGGIFTAGRPNILSVNKSASQLTAGVNGTTSTAANATSILVANDYSIRLGSAFTGVAETFNNGSIGEVFTYDYSIDNIDTQVINTYLAIKNGVTLTHNYYSPNYDGTNAATTTLYDISTYANRIFGIGKDESGCFNQKQSISTQGNLVAMSLSSTLEATNDANTAVFDVNRSYAITGDDNGAFATFNKTELPVFASDLCDYYRISREWKIKATKADLTPTIFAYDNTHPSASMKLPIIPVTHKLVLIINENSDFTVNANQQEIDMIFDNTNKLWSVAIPLEKNKEYYYTFAIKRKKCAKECVPSNVNIQSK